MSKPLRGTGLLLALLLLGLVVLPAGSAEAAGRVVRHDFFGVQDDRQTNASRAYGSARIWAAWCSVQPTQRTNATKSAKKLLGRAFELNAAAGRTRVTVSLGHPAPWVFRNHKNARKHTGVWYCGQNRSVIAFPSATSLRSNGWPRGVYAAYVTGVIAAAKPYLKANKANRLVLQAWNEPNLGSGGKINTKIPGAARTWTQAAESLREQERIMRSIASKMIPGRFEITTPSMYGKTTKLGTPYFKLQAKSRTVDSISLNFYTLYVKTPNSSLTKWRSRATRALKVVHKHKALRSVPIWITETNHNLVNSGKRTNRKATWISPAAQKRLMQVTTMEALRMGFAGIQWYQGTTLQVAVNARAGSAATTAGRQLRDQLEGRRVLSCKGGSTSWCKLSARKGSPPITVTWKRSGSAGVTIKRS